jgi:hypothetical protein
MVLRFVTKLLHLITLKKVLLWSSTALLAAILYTTYENRQSLFDKITPEKDSGLNPINITFTVGHESRRKIEQFVRTNNEVVGFSIFTADLRLNRRTSIYFFGFEDGRETQSPTSNSPFNRLPLFSSSEENNRQIVKLINGEFHCSQYSTSLLAITNPSLNPNVKTVCRASLPPYYGNFIGFVTVFIKIEPNPEEQVRLKSIIESLATEIYFRDVLNTLRRSPD